MVDPRIKNIRKMPTKELKTYNKAYQKGQVYKFARDEAAKELKRRESGTPLKPKKKKQPSRDEWGCF